MGNADAARMSARIRPICKSRYRRRKSAGEPRCNANVRCWREFAVPDVGLQRIEDGRHRPRADWNVFENRMQRMSQPRSTQKGLDCGARAMLLPNGLAERRLHRIRERI